MTHDPQFGLLKNNLQGGWTDDPNTFLNKGIVRLGFIFTVTGLEFPGQSEIERELANINVYFVIFQDSINQNLDFDSNEKQNKKQTQSTHHLYHRLTVPVCYKIERCSTIQPDFFHAKTRKIIPILVCNLLVFVALVNSIVLPKQTTTNHRQYTRAPKHYTNKRQKDYTNQKKESITSIK